MQNRLTVCILTFAMFLCAEAVAHNESNPAAKAKMVEAQKKRVGALTKALISEGIRGATTLQLAKDVFQGEEEPMNAFQVLQKSLQSTSFKAAEDAEVITIVDSKSGEKLVLETIIGGCDGCDVMNSYLENLKPSVEQAKTMRNMIGKFKGVAFWSGETIPTDTEITQLPNGILSGKYVAHPKGKPPEPGVLRQIGVLNGRQVQFKCDDDGTNDGFLRVTFGDNFGNFDGQFSEEADFSNSLKWTGKRLAK